MDAQRKHEIRRLALDAHLKRKRYEAMGMMNSNIDPKEQEQLAMDYALAEAEAIEAREVLRKAIESPNYEIP